MFASRVSIWTWLCRCALLLGVATGIAPAQQDTSGKAVSDGRALRHTRLYGLASARALNGLNRSDACAAFKVWFDVLGQQRGFVLDSEFAILDSVTEIKARLLSHSVEVLMLGLDDYLELETSRLVVPVLTDNRNSKGGALYSYVLLVNPSAGATTIAGLRGKTVLISSRGGGNTAYQWLDVVLGREKLGRAATFFASTKALDKAPACVLPLFFGKVDSCVVDEVSLNVAKEMNPQLGKLRVLARSRPMIETIFATPVVPGPYQTDLIDAMLALQESPRGRQLLTVFKTDRLVRIQPGDLDAARLLWREYSRLPPASPNRIPVATAPAGKVIQTAERKGSDL